MRRRQAGVALLAAVLVVALASVLIAALLDRGEHSRARSRNSLRSEQTWQLALGAEQWVQAILQRDGQESGGIDARGDAWAQPIPPLPVPGGLLHGRLRDASGCFNLNNLVTAEGEQAIQLQRLRLLLRALKLDEGLADAIADWIDADALPRNAGAEDASYLGLRPAYRAGNGPMTHVSELRLVRGVSAEVFDRLRPHVCALPAPSTLNLNFASPQLWMSLDERITESVASQLWRDGQARFDNTERVAEELLRLGIAEVPMLGLATHSNYFVLEAEVETDGLPFQFGSLLYRDERGVRTLARIRGRW